MSSSATVAETSAICVPIVPQGRRTRKHATNIHQNLIRLYTLGEWTFRTTFPHGMKPDRPACVIFIISQHFQLMTPQAALHKVSDDTRN